MPAGHLGDPLAISIAIAITIGTCCAPRASGSELPGDARPRRDP